MAKKYLDYSGLSYFWGKLKALFGTKADKVANATNGNFAGLDANGNLTDSGKKASDFTKVEASNTNGNIKIDSVETTVYSHPTTTAAAAAAVKVGKDSLGHVVLGGALTKSDVGLGNVGNFKAVSTVAGQDLSATEKSNARANIGAGTVTSVGMSAPTGFSVSGSPVTSSGTLALSFASGYSLPTTAKQTNWDTAYTNSHTHSNKTVLDGISSTKVSNWDTAYGWGNHATQGYFDGVQWDDTVGVAGGLSFMNGQSGDTVEIEYSSYARKLGTGSDFEYSEGSATNPVYFDSGAPVACTYSLNKTVPSNAVFTDTWQAATTSQVGYAPRLQLASTPTISSQTNDYVLTYTSGTETAPVWRRLPANAFNNTWVALSSSNAGYAPAANNGQSTSSSNTYYFLGYNNNNVGWYHLPANAFNNTTYESKAAASGGTDVSLVTTGEKYTWNNKISSADLTTHAKAADTSTANQVLVSSVSGGTTSYAWKDYDPNQICAVSYTNVQNLNANNQAIALSNIEGCQREFISDYSKPYHRSNSHGGIYYDDNESTLVWEGYYEGRAYKLIDIDKNNKTLTILFHGLYQLHDDYVLLNNNNKFDITVSFDVQDSTVLNNIEGSIVMTVGEVLAPSNITIPAKGCIEMSAVGIPTNIEDRVAIIVVTVSEPLTAYTS